jgi:hypothetical protein
MRSSLIAVGPHPHGLRSLTLAILITGNKPPSEALGGASPPGLRALALAILFSSN